MALKTINRVFGAQRDQAYTGRGAGINLEGRFEAWQRESFIDGWAAEEHEASAPKTIITHGLAKSIISSNDSPDIPFRYSLNLYRSCGGTP